MFGHWFYWLFLNLRGGAIKLSLIQDRYYVVGISILLYISKKEYVLTLEYLLHTRTEHLSNKEWTQYWDLSCVGVGIWEIGVRYLRISRVNGITRVKVYDVWRDYIISSTWFWQLYLNLRCQQVSLFFGLGAFCFGSNTGFFVKAVAEVAVKATMIKGGKSI